MLGFSNSFHYIIFTASMPSVSDIQIHTFISFTKSSLVHQYQSIRHRPTIFAILQQLMMDRLPKKFAQPINPSTATALPSTPSNLQWTHIRDFQTWTRTRNPGLTFHKPENPGLQKEPGFGNSNHKETARCSMFFPRPVTLWLSAKEAWPHLINSSRLLHWLPVRVFP